MLKVEAIIQGKCSRVKRVFAKLARHCKCRVTKSRCIRGQNDSGRFPLVLMNASCPQRGVRCLKGKAERKFKRIIFEEVIKRRGRR